MKDVLNSHAAEVKRTPSTGDAAGTRLVVTDTARATYAQALIDLMDEGVPVVVVEAGSDQMSGTRPSRSNIRSGSSTSASPSRTRSVWHPAWRTWA